MNQIPADEFIKNVSDVKNITKDSFLFKYNNIERKAIFGVKKTNMLHQILLSEKIFKNLTYTNYAIVPPLLSSQAPFNHLNISKDEPGFFFIERIGASEKIVFTSIEQIRETLFQILFHMFLANSTYGITYNTIENRFNIVKEKNPFDLTYNIGNVSLKITNAQYRVYFDGSYLSDNVNSINNYKADFGAFLKYIDKLNVKDDNLNLLKADLKKDDLAFGLPPIMTWGYEAILFHPFFLDYYQGETPIDNSTFSVKEHLPFWKDINPTVRNQRETEINNHKESIQKIVDNLTKSNVKELIRPLLKETFELIYNRGGKQTSFVNLDSSLLDKQLQKLWKKIVEINDKNFNNDNIDHFVENGVLKKDYIQHFNYLAGITGYVYYPNLAEKEFYIFLNIINYLISKKYFDFITDEILNNLATNKNDINHNLNKDIINFRRSFGGLGGREFVDVMQNITDYNKDPPDFNDILTLKKEAEEMKLTPEQSTELNNKINVKREEYIKYIKTFTDKYDTIDNLQKARSDLEKAEKIPDNDVKNAFKDARTNLDKAEKTRETQDQLVKEMTKNLGEMKTEIDSYTNDKNTSTFEALFQKYTADIKSKYTNYEKAVELYDLTEGSKYYPKVDGTALKTQMDEIDAYLTARKTWVDFYKKWVENLNKIDFNGAKDIGDLKTKYNEYVTIFNEIKYGLNNIYKQTNEGKNMRDLLVLKNNEYKTKKNDLEKSPIKKLYEELPLGEIREHFSVENYEKVTNAKRRDNFEKAIELTKGQKELPIKAIRKLFFGDIQEK